MALDGAFLYKLKTEIEEKALGARVDKIFQPSRDELVLLVRRSGFSGKLLLSAAPSAARIHFTRFAPENPASPPMFCMLLRKQLSGARLVSVRQYGLDRVMELEFEARDEMGDLISPRLVIEIMGSRSNIIFIGGDGRIIDAVRRSDLEGKATRMIQPGVTYHPPEPQEKLDITSAPADAVIRKIKESPDAALAALLSKTLEGASPVVCRELAFKACRDTDCAVSDMTEGQFERLEIFLGMLKDEILTGGHPVLICDAGSLPFDFSYTAITQYGTSAITSEPEDYSALLDDFYAKRERAARMKRRSSDLLKTLTLITSRISRKLDAQRGDLAKCADREKFRVFGELLKANLHLIERGASAAVVQNYYDPELSNVKIPLNSAISPAANAQKYFKDYKKSYTAEQTLTRLIAEGEEELKYLDSVFDALSRASGESDLSDIREELESAGYIRTLGRKQKKAFKPSPPMKFVSSDGVDIFVGRNNKQNDQLTLKTANRDDIWLHVKDMPGSHVIIATAGKDAPPETLKEAAVLAAYFSKGRDSSSVPVDYTSVRRVKKPSGAKPGMVIYENNRTIYVTPDEEVCRRLSGREVF